jgi:hypothetical protein
MRTPWKRNREGQDFDAWVRTRPPEATREILEQLVARAPDEAHGYSRRPLRLVFAVSFAIIVAVALASVGGFSYAASTVEQSVQQAQAIFSPAAEPVVSSPGDGQYKPGKGCGDKNHIHDREAECKISVNDVSQKEGNSGTTPFVFTVSLNGFAIDPVTVDYNTLNGTASSLTDYVPASGTLIFAAGESSKTVAVSVTGDTTKEQNETFFVKLLNPTGNAVIVDDTGKGTIQNDDK